ncbi:hypothetical protein PILCRDRAFT_469308 [Piloderma croceum F 1598]|uniref:Uncharacterized protein n=1 Tax=Piloderma croceum (strain F 1598) TaxID=765440 RepID=A0A0C3BZ53_PILCF|nr:hypothetical protein PILCRDRAFT_469308 [Piloderma croceum F 1598]
MPIANILDEQISSRETLDGSPVQAADAIPTKSASADLGIEQPMEQNLLPPTTDIPGSPSLPSAGEITTEPDKGITSDLPVQIEEINELGISNLTAEDPPVHVRDGNSS